MYVYLLVIPLVLIVVHFLFNYNETAILLRKIPGLKDAFIVGNALDALKTPVQLFSFGRQLARENNGIYRFWSFPFGAVNIYNPEDIEVILSSMKYHEKSDIYGFLKSWLQDGLLLSYGTKWQNRRKILTPAFHFNILRRYFINFEENASRLVEKLEKTLDLEVDIIPIISECTLNSICETAMGTKLKENSTGKLYKNAIHELGTVLTQRFVRLYLYIDYLFKLSELGRKQMKNLTIVHDFTRKVIKNRRNDIKENGANIFDSTNNEDEDNDEYKLMYSKKKKAAMLDLLILAEKDGLIDSVGIEEEVDTFMFEGHDTTASGLTYCLMLLANHPQIQEKIVMELKEIFGETKRATTVEDLNAMRYLDRCIKESMRLYPPVPFISRKLTENVTLSNYLVPAGTLCHIHIYDLHRQENLYPSPTEFDPDRFLPEMVAKRHNYAYIPFSAGPRNCIVHYTLISYKNVSSVGHVASYNNPVTLVLMSCNRFIYSFLYFGQKFAMMEMKSILTAILRNYKLHPVTSCADLLFQADLVLRNSKPVYVKFSKRQTII